MGALVLSRRRGESILIGDDVKVTIGQINGHQVKLVIEAPREVTVLREELVTRGGEHD